MRPAFRLILAAAIAVVISSGIRAQQPEKYAKRNAFVFAPAPAAPELTEIPRDDIDDVLGAQAELKLRPNAATELYLWVLNPRDADPAKDRDDFIVEMEVARGGPVVRKSVTIPARTWVRVRLEKPAPPPPPAAATAAPAANSPAAPAAKAPEPPPPGVALPLTRGESLLTFRLLDKTGKALLETDGNGKPFGRDFRVSLRPLSDYVNSPELTITPSERDVRLTATVNQKPFRYPGSVPVQLLIPPQPALSAAMLREGFYRRTLTIDTSKDSKGNSVTLSGRVENPGQKFRVYVGVDGIDRAFGYTIDVLGTTPMTQIFPDTAAAVRVFQVAPKTVTAPIADYPVLVQVDKPGDNDTLELHLRPVSGAAELTEIVKLDSVRDNRIWLDPAGPTDGGLLFTTRSRDWVKPLDLSHMQGNVEVYGVLRQKGDKGDKDVKSDNSLVLTVDGTPPEPITFLRIPRTLEKGKPLSLKASVNDPDTNVTRATFFIFRAFEDGKIPADAIKAVGTQSLTNPRIWGASVPVPADFRGDALVAVLFANEAGLISEVPLVQRIEIVDPQPPAGNITGKVEYGDRLQPGVPVSLRDAEGKEKAATTTDGKGAFAFANVPVGSYKVVAIRKDSSTGAAGLATVQVDATHTPDNPVKVNLTLNKIRQ